MLTKHAADRSVLAAAHLSVLREDPSLVKHDMKEKRFFLFLSKVPPQMALGRLAFQRLVQFLANRLLSESSVAGFMEAGRGCGTEAITADWRPDRGALSHTTCTVELRRFISPLLFPPYLKMHREKF